MQSYNSELTAYVKYKPVTEIITVGFISHYSSCQKIRLVVLQVPEKSMPSIKLSSVSMQLQSSTMDKHFPLICRSKFEIIILRFMTHVPFSTAFYNYLH